MGVRRVWGHLFGLHLSVSSNPDIVLLRGTRSFIGHVHGTLDVDL